MSDGILNKPFALSMNEQRYLKAVNEYANNGNKYFQISGKGLSDITVKFKIDSEN